MQIHTVHIEGVEQEHLRQVDAEDEYVEELIILEILEIHQDELEEQRLFMDLVEEEEEVIMVEEEELNLHQVEEEGHHM